MQRLGLYYDREFLSKRDCDSIISYLQSLHPIWEMRYSKSNPPPAGQVQRQLLRPVYWLGNWQFACLDYYHPPKGIRNRCVVAESFPSFLQNIVYKAEEIAKHTLPERDFPKGWHMNTCLVNFYGDQITDAGRRIDAARVGEHKDFEPGPVISLSMGERALFQFVESHSREGNSRVVFEQWLDHGSLQIFGGDKFKSRLFHRVQRVDKKQKIIYDFKNVQNFETRRINLTFRYVPLDHFVHFRDLPKNLQDDVQPYMAKLAEKNDFFSKELSSNY